MRPVIFLAAVLIVAGCAVPASTLSRPDAYYDQVSAAETTASLFAADSETLSDEAIRQILAYDYTPPALSRVALMPFGRETFSGWSEELAFSSESMQARVLETLRASPKVYDASYLPSILVPETRTVPHLREAAARYQADLLLVYRSYCRSFEKYRLFGADRSRAYCGVEAVLLDTRTGLVPFTTVATRAYDVVENPADTNFRETQLRAQLDATSAALGDVSEEVVRFLAGES
ncbi:MAG: hypothetical protein R3315_07830 [Woeseiaceae bacterium]|nr:hypothetical protein [Woeseiaceae bacterium]